MGLTVEKVSFIILLVQLGYSRVSRLSEVRVGIRVSVSIRVSLVSVIGWA